MGRKGNWFSAVKKVLSTDPTKNEKKQKSKKKWFGNHKDLEPALAYGEAPFAVPPALLPIEDMEIAQSKNAYSVALATAVAAEAAVAAAEAAAEVVRLTSVPRYPGKSKEEIAAIKIQTAFRGYLARRALRALRGLVRLKTLIQGQSVKRQAVSTLRCMQTLARLQSQVHARRVRVSEENQAHLRQLQEKHDKEIEKLQVAVPTGEEWDHSLRSKEQLEAKLLKRQEAAMRRERALAYSFSHQRTWKNSLKSANPTVMDPNNPHWGWSWPERTIVAWTWENRSTMDHDRASAKSVASQSMSVGEITKLYSLRDHNHDHNKPSPAGQKSSRPPSHQSPSTPASKAPSLSVSTGKVMPPSPKGSAWSADDDSRSTFSSRSQRQRRHTISGSSSMREDESLSGSPAFPSYMVPTKSTKAKSRLQSPSPSGADKKGTLEKGPVVSAKKRLSFPDSPAGSSSRKYSTPPKVDFISNKDAATITEEKVSK